MIPSIYLINIFVKKKIVKKWKKASTFFTWCEKNNNIYKITHPNKHFH